MQQVNGVQVYNSDPSLLYEGLDKEPTWFSAQGGVYQCYERSSRRPIAIKKYLVEDNNKHPDMFVMPQELVENEIYTMTKCNHTNILKLLSVHLHQEYVYLIMPLCGGGSLQQYVFEHHLNYGQLAHIVASIAAGLEEIHRHGYIHRDIKCDNIFLDDQANQVVIGDFGVVSITPAADSSLEEAGVVLFWAPELVQGKLVNRKIDIWALGIVILEIINGGRAPYEDEKLDEEEIKQRILTIGKPAYPEGLPSRLLDLLDCCLNPDPRARASASDILKHPFLLDYDHEPLFATAASTTTTTATESDDYSVLCSIDPNAVDEGSMLNALKTLQDMKPMDELDLNLESTVPDLSDTSDSLSSSQSHRIDPITSPVPRRQHVPSRKCRLPVASFVLNDDYVDSIPAKDKIAHVRQKRQSLTEEHRNQGSRLPMLKIILAVPTSPSPPPTPGKKLRKAKSVRLCATSPVTPQASNNRIQQKPERKPLLRSQTLPTQPKRASPSSLPKSTEHHRQTTTTTTATATRLPSLGKPSTPVAATPGKKKSSLTPPTQPLAYRQKRLPESRTARLMMGISTTGRRTSKADTATLSPPTPEVTKTTSKRLSSALAASLSSKKRSQETKQRPLSFSGPKSTTSAVAMSSFSTHRREYPLPPPLPALPQSYGRYHQKDDEQYQKSALTPPVSPAKLRRRVSAPSSKHEPTSPTSPTSGSSFGKSNNLKGMKVLRAY
ncbi:kinase-like domain-containing protein [Halteromyces radiatus]|uniref:kinase-like domain-containing protein n=1 Tax=Halteromyces radiatus TaxID=101107 RepID=UPI00222062E4|nr:kinase-like domain-containing protein [Halteromyces radiatus]KAI8076754.1 kinase-like domain-containing protein [Halteromyces radiatus]